MGQSDGFGLHIEFANHVLARSVDLAPSGRDDLQVKLPAPPEMVRGALELTRLSEGVGYGRWACDDVLEQTSMDTELPPDYLAFPFHLLPEPITVTIVGREQPILLARTESYILGPLAAGTQTLHPGVSVHQTCMFLNSQVIESCFSDSRVALPAAVKRAFTHADSEPFCLRGCTTTAMGLALRQMLTCSLRGPLARLYLEAKVLEIAALRLTQLGSGPGPRKPLVLMRSDVDRLEEARQILAACYEEPPSIIDLSLAVGLNRTKLKAGFKARFGTTIFGYIRAQRMRRALLLLRDGKCNVGEAAAVVGYNSLSAFAAAFKA
ncbi:MAG: AraC family transcriptional regulator, partial [Spirochaeta sp.]|nr:AraC family transcriptional regulator [Spirochaeta sp.]